MQAGEFCRITDELDLFAKPFRHCPKTDLECFHDILLLGGNETFLVACLASFLTSFLTSFLAALIATFFTELFGE